MPGPATSASGTRGLHWHESHGRGRHTRLAQPLAQLLTRIQADLLAQTGGGWLYLATWLDRYSRKVVGWDVRESMPEDLVSEALRRALAVHQPAAELLVHSDQGGQYSATTFKALVARHEALQSMSWRGNCYANAHAESFGNRLKTELLDGGSFRNLSEARLEISHYLAYYNAERRHLALGYLAPNHSKPIFKPCPNSGRVS
jgi:putative transposase